MNCNKCGTPIIPGENTCRFCGTSNNFSKREEKHEIIGFDDIDLLDNDNIQEAEIIDFMIGEDEVSLNEKIDHDELIYEIFDNFDDNLYNLFPVNFLLKNFELGLFVI